MGRRVRTRGAIVRDVGSELQQEGEEEEEEEVEEEEGRES